MIIYFSIITLFYIVLVTIFLTGWERMSSRKKTKTNINNFFTVIIPVKNEEENIQNLLNDLNEQEYNDQYFEVIVINDNSTDNTANIVRYNIPLFKCPLKLINLPGKIEGSTKKLAITEGVKQARGDFIITTDGDCRVKKSWLKAYNDHFNSTKSNFIAGPVTFHQEKSFFQQLQTIEFASLIGSGAASIYFKYPNMSNAANMAFKKSIFNELEGYKEVSHIISGDDEFLMQKFHRLDEKKVTFLKQEKAIVTTYPQKTLNEFIHQRRRWAGKWKNHEGNHVKFLAVFIFLYHFSLMLMVILSITGYYPLSVLLIQFIFKVLTEFLFLKKVLAFFNKKLNIFRFLILQVMYSFYVVLFGFLANFGSYNWKGRTYRVKEKLMYNDRSGI